MTPHFLSQVAPKHKYEKKDLKKEYFKCPCAGFNIDPGRARPLLLAFIRDTPEENEMVPNPEP